MKLIPPITIDDTNMTTDAAVESYDEWGVDYSFVTLATAGTTIRRITYNTQNGDMWAIGYAGANIYKKPANSETFSLVHTQDQLQYIQVNPYTGRLYFTRRDDDGSGDRELYELDTNSYGATLLDSLSSAAGGSGFLTTDFFTSDIYVDGASGNIYKYTDSSAALTLHAASGLVIASLCVDSNTKDLFVVNTSDGDVYKQTAGTGSFNLLVAASGPQLYVTDPLTSDTYLINSASSDPRVYVIRSGGSTLIELYDVPLSRTNDFFFDWTAGSYFFVTGLDLYVKAYTARYFAEDDYCIYNDRVYLALADTYNDNPATETTKWFDYGATNPYRMLDGSIESSTTATEEINLTLENDNVTAIAFFGVTAESITVTLTVDTVEVYSETKELRATEVGDWYEYFFNPINQIKDTVFTGIPSYQSGDFDIVISGASETDTVEVGLMVAGYSYDVGTTKPDVKPGFVDYSTVTTDDFGRITITERGSAKTLDCSVHVEDRDKVTTVLDLMNRTRGLKCLWIASKDEDSWSLIYGVRKRFDMVARNTNGEYTLQILGVV